MFPSSWEGKKITGTIQVGPFVLFFTPRDEVLSVTSSSLFLRQFIIANKITRLYLAIDLFLSYHYGSKLCHFRYLFKAVPWRYKR